MSGKKIRFLPPRGASERERDFAINSLIKAARAPSGDLTAANNLSDVANVVTARTNLGLGAADLPQFAGITLTELAAPSAPASGLLALYAKTDSKIYSKDADGTEREVGATGRELLTSHRAYYVRTDGSDSNDGLSDTSGGAFLTIQKAVDTVAALDLSIFDVTINVAAGTYTGAVVINSPWVGAGDVKIVGDATTPANVVISTTNAHCISAKNFGRIKVSGIKFQTTTFGIALVAILGGTIEVIGPVNFGACATYHMNATQNGMLSCAGVNYTISGPTANHAVADARGYIYVAVNTITLAGTPAIGTFAQANRMGLLEFISNSFSGSATGKRYSAANAGGIFVAGGGASYFPGNSAGTATSPGWYK